MHSCFLRALRGLLVFALHTKISSIKLSRANPLGTLLTSHDPRKAPNRAGRASDRYLLRSDLRAINFAYGIACVSSCSAECVWGSC